jgi:predicted MFS family arabinose efflux permease
MLENVLGYTAKEAGLMLALQGIAIIITTSRIKSLASKYSKTIIIATGFVFVGLAIISISLAHSIVAVLPLLLLFGAGYGLAQTAIDTQIIHISPSESKGGVLSIHNTMKFIGTSLSPIILGIVLSYFSLEAVFIVAGSFGLIVALITYLMKSFFEISNNEHEKDTKISLPH